MNDIRIEHLSKSFGDRPVLKDISMIIPNGSRLCVYGASGCGKTTFLRILMRLDSPTNGLISGIPKRIASVFQEDRLCETLTALGNVRLTADIPQDLCADLLSKLGLKDALYHPVSALSGGMKRRVAIARALAHRSDLLILDEPFSGLDADTAAISAEIIQTYTKDRTIVYSAHAPVDYFSNSSFLKLDPSGSATTSDP